MKLSKEELLTKIREHGGENPDDFTISMLEDIADSIDESVVDNSAELEALKTANTELTAAKDTLQAAYDALKVAYADRFTLKEDEVKDETVDEEEKEREEAESIDSFDDIF